MFFNIESVWLTENIMRHRYKWINIMAKKRKGFRLKKIVKASPTKEFFVSMLVRDILLKQAIIELIDNSLDGARKIRKEPNFSGLYIKINFDREKFEIIDNCGGIPIDIAEEYAFRFGRPSNIENVGGETTGIFGIGMKRALFKMGNNIVIKSITETSDFQVTIDVEKWLSLENKEWDFSFDEYNEHAKHSEDEVGTTIIVTDLNKEISNELSDSDFEKELIEHIERRVGLDIKYGIDISINEKVIHGNYVRMISSDEISPVKESYVDKPSGVKVEIIAGIAPKEENNKHLPENAGWYLYCNGRLIVAADKSSLTTWKDIENKSSGLSFHNQYASFRGIVFFSSDNPALLPWNTTKTGIDSTSMVYIQARERMLEIFKIVRGFYDEAKKYSKENEDDGLELSIDKMSYVEVTRETNEKSINTNRAMSIKNIVIDPNPSVNISYKKPKAEVERIKNSLEVSTNKDVGIKTFEYYLDAEC